MEKKTIIVSVIITLFLIAIVGATTIYNHGNKIINNGEQIFMVSHTEYRYNEQAQIVVRLTDFQGNPVTVDACNATILYPNKTYYLQNQAMTATGNIAGDYYYEFTTPSDNEGIYEYQATCSYASGTKTRSATNSFHLSSILPNIYDNLTTLINNVNDFRNEVSQNFTYVDNLLLTINSTNQANTITINQINNTVNTINNNLNSFITNTTNSLSGINTTILGINDTVNTILTDILSINTTTITKIDEIKNTLNDIQTSIDGNFTTIIDDIADVNTLINDVNTSIQNRLTNIDGSLTSINNTITNYYNDLIGAIQNTNLTITTKIDELQLSMANNFTYIQGNLTDIMTAIQAIPTINYTAILNQINSTTINTYDYMTGTLANNINDILSSLGIINATVNRIETTTNNINTTTNTILQNQEDEVFIQVYSGWK